MRPMVSIKAGVEFVWLLSDDVGRVVSVEENHVTATIGVGDDRRETVVTIADLLLLTRPVGGVSMFTSAGSRVGGLVEWEATTTS